MLLLAAFALQPESAPPRLRIQSTGSVRIERPLTASAADWARAPKPIRRETIRLDEQGRPVLLRLIENR